MSFEAGRPIGSRIPFKERRSDDLEEIMSGPLPVVARAGWVGLALLAFILLGLSLTLRFPTSLRARVHVTAQEQPVEFVSRAPGLVRLLVDEGAPVAANDLIAIIDGPSDYRAMLALRAWLSNFWSDFAVGRRIASPPMLRPDKLGPVSASYYNLISSLHGLEVVRDQEVAASTLDALANNARAREALRRDYDAQLAIAQRAAAETQNAIEVRRPLRERGLVTRSSMEEITRALFEQKARIKDIIISREVNDIEAGDIHVQAHDARRSRAQREESAVGRVQDAAQKLQDHISAWEAAYIFISPISGRIRLFEYWKSGQYVKIGRRLLLVEPPVSDVEATGFISAAGFGRVERGQKVLIDLDDYPRKQFGQVTGTVLDFSAISDGDRYRTRVALPNGLRTTRGHRLRFSPNMPGSAKILLAPTRLYERAIDWFINV